MAFTPDQLTALESAIGMGALRVRYADRDVTYHSLDQMLQLRNQIRAELGLSQSNPTNKGGKMAFVTGKGL
jgi:hypothetical protein